LYSSRASQVSPVEALTVAWSRFMSHQAETPGMSQPTCRIESISRIHPTLPRAVPCGAT
jgi:hypothetical protein